MQSCDIHARSCTDCMYIKRYLEGCAPQIVHGCETWGDFFKLCYIFCIAWAFKMSILCFDLKNQVFIYRMKVKSMSRLSWKSSGASMTLLQSIARSPNLSPASCFPHSCWVTSSIRGCHGACCGPGHGTLEDILMMCAPQFPIHKIDVIYLDWMVFQLCGL